jgi:hypothetical protein
MTTKPHHYARAAVPAGGGGPNLLLPENMAETLKILRIYFAPTLKRFILCSKIKSI